MCGAKVVGNTQKFCAECGFKLIDEDNTKSMGTTAKNHSGRKDDNNEIIELSADELECKGKEAKKKGDYKKAIELFTMSYEKGNKDVALILGVMYAGGQGVTKDDVIAEKWFRKLNRKMDGEDTYFIIGSMYAAGQMVPKDIRNAIKWYEMAAYNGNSESAFILGNWYFLGEEVPKDVVRAIKWLEMASKGKVHGADILLGTIYLSGAGVKRDSKKGLAYLKDAANAGVPEAMAMLGHLYEKGNIDIRADSEKSRKWYEKAAKVGYKG